MSETTSMTGKEAYEEDVRRCPTYPHSGGPRKTWEQLSDLVRSTWEKNPTPRNLKGQA